MRPIPLPPAELVKLRLEDDLEAAVGLVPEDVVSVRGLFQRQRRAEVILTPAGQLVSRAAGIVPGLTTEILHLVQRLALPDPPGQPGTAAAGETQGHELRPAMGKKAFDHLTALGQAAASRFNERR